ncbi:MAG: inorganic diphosphatase [Aurantibacter sp.]
MTPHLDNLKISIENCLVKSRVLLALLPILILGCSQKVNLYAYQTFHSKNIVNCIIEIPAGTNKKIEYNSKLGAFVVDQRNGIDRQIDFLPYPSNYGFIPSSHSDPATGGDGDALDIIVISESLKTGTIIPSIPIGVFKLIDDGEEDYKILCIPFQKDKRIISAKNFLELQEKYPKIIEILEQWFLNYDTRDPLVSKGWGDEKEALRIIGQSEKSLETKNSH